MSDEKVYIRKLYDITEIPAPDDLVQGKVFSARIQIVMNSGVEYPRGLLMMSDSTGKFIPATKDGLSTAKELCILCESMLSDETETQSALTFGYFEGEFNADRIRLSYEDEDENHLLNIEEIESVLRMHGMYVR